MCFLKLLLRTVFKNIKNIILVFAENYYCFFLIYRVMCLSIKKKKFLFIFFKTIFENNFRKYKKLYFSVI